ncbi:MGMT family protein [Paenibacillus hodogayensis]|uniref:MGMT family protein n=1 Tax=Paenibacillus hodogayensis TaxID=279208 RepID=A0ABV5W186_9BACL
MQPFTRQVIDIIRSIPAGCVMTYGQIAGMAGSPRAARQVVRILHSSSRAHKLPWHRVINAKGEVAVQEEESRFEQIMQLQHEGVEVDEDGKVDLDRFQFRPSSSADAPSSTEPR